MNNNPLGQKVEYSDNYDPSLLYSIPRNKGRAKIFSSDDIRKDNLTFKCGYDIWNCYEVSWLNENGKPEVRIITLIVPFSSPNIFESKSLKLYLNSFNNTKFADDKNLEKAIRKDLSAAAGAEIEVRMYKLAEFSHKIIIPAGQSLDDIDITMDNYEIDPKILSHDASGEIISEELYSDLLRSNCLVTGQPDWGTISISYQGKKIDHASLLKYIVSFRNHIEFHEQCVERIFNDITKQCSPSKLTVYARYARRGGIDINPMRSSSFVDILGSPYDRLIRQ